MRCEWCRTAFKPKALGRAPKFCSPKCRHAACVKRNGTWETQERQKKKAWDDQLLRDRIRRELRPIVRRELTQELIQSRLLRITGPDHVNVLIAGRNEWRGNKVLAELEQDFAAAGNPEAVAAIREWRRLGRELSGNKRSAARRHPQRQAEVPGLLPPDPLKAD